jgi:hypothetical protein
MNFKILYIAISCLAGASILGMDFKVDITSKEIFPGVFSAVVKIYNRPIDSEAHRTQRIANIATTFAALKKEYPKLSNDLNNYEQNTLQFTRQLPIVGQTIASAHSATSSSSSANTETEESKRESKKRKKK